MIEKSKRHAVLVTGYALMMLRCVIAMCCMITELEVYTMCKLCICQVYTQYALFNMHSATWGLNHLELDVFGTLHLCINF